MPDLPGPTAAPRRLAHPSRWTRPLTAGALVLASLSACAAPVSAPSPVTGASNQPMPAISTSDSVGPSATASPSRPSASASATPKPVATKAPKDTRAGTEMAKPFTVNGIPVISKKHPINAQYRRSSVTAPYGLTNQTQAALSKMVAAARAKGVTILVRSGYRSYALQAQILASKIKEYGSESLARRYNAAPGRSEHQTGLAIDLWDGVTWGVGVRNTRTGKWLWANAWRYGFILRYPNGKEKITGYAFEPWHYRWIGTADAKNFGPNTNLTLEEYLGIA